MVARFFFLSALFAVSVQAASQSAVLQLSPPIVVAGGTTYNSTKPRIALVNDSIPIISWGKPSPGGKVFVSKWNGTGFTTPLQVSPAALNTYTNANDGPNIAAKGDTVYITYFSMAGVITKIYVHHSYDGGITFSDTVRADNQYPNVNKYAYSPFVAIAPGGDPYLCYETSTSTLSFPQQLFNKSGDGGQSFAAEVSASDSAPGEPCECCPPSIALKDSMVYMLYRNNINNLRDIYCAVSSNYGNSFDTAVRIDYSYWYINGCPSQGPEPYIWNDTLVGVWMSDPGSFARINIGTMHAYTLQFGDSYYADTSVAPGTVQRHPSIAGNGDTIGIAWDDNRYGSGTDCFISVSLNGTAGFGNTVMINDSAVLGNQVTPHIAYHNGTFHIVYQNVAGNQVIYRRAKITGALGDGEISAEDIQVKVFPNPASEAVTFQLPSAIQGDMVLKIYDASGRVLGQHMFSGTRFVMERGHLASGIYFYTLASDKGTFVSGKFSVR
ncbi:MAG: T9SS type A sorting domain-containing protein [Bacteroidota bacterium]